jgi:3-ketosteroid 9alpha-monooxygenase subunit B
MSDRAGEPLHEQVLREHGSHQLAVKAIVDETGDTRSFVLDVPDQLSGTFTYRPGQFCTFRAHVGGDELWRSYSMSSTPGLDPDLTVTVKRVPGGLVSNWFNDAVAVGDVLDVTKPAGVFCPTDRDVPVVAFCGGSGITPVFSIVKHVLEGTGRPVTLLYANRDCDSVIFGDALRLLEARHPDRLDLRQHFDSDRGYLGRSDIATFVVDNLDADFYICGPTPFMDLVETTLHDAGVDPAHIAIERFLVGGPTEHPDEADEIGEVAGKVPEAITLILRRKKTTPTGPAIPSWRRPAVAGCNLPSRARPATARRAWRSCARARRRCARTTRSPRMRSPRGGSSRVRRCRPAPR